MTVQTHIQLKLQRDTGSIFYQDKDDDLTFHIEALRSTSPTPSADNGESRDQAPMASRAASPDREEESAATTDLVKSFLRQHLIKNGARPRGLIPLMKRDGIQALLFATMVVHLHKDGHGEGEDDVRDDAAAIRSLHKTLGSLVSVLQQREKVLGYLEGSSDALPRDEAEPNGGEQ